MAPLRLFLSFRVVGVEIEHENEKKDVYICR